MGNINYKVSPLTTLTPHSFLSSDVEREEKQLHYYQVKLEAAETKLRDFENYFNNADRSDLIKNLIDEKESQTLKIFHLSEKIKVINEREQTLKSEVQEAKDQAELLEFRVLELEECQEKVRRQTGLETCVHVLFYQIKTSRPDGKLSQDIGTETDSDLIDSGRSSLRHSRSSSVTNDWEETQNFKPDFGVSHRQELEVFYQNFCRMKKFMRRNRSFTV